MYIILIVSTIPHYISLYFFNNINNNFFYKLYYNIIIISSTFSVIWHLSSESNGIIMILDYVFAFSWFIIELFISTIYFNSRIVKNVILTNILVYLTYILNTILLDDWISYKYSHSIWHIISFTKCIFISYLLNK
jgi:hypothetical protein